MRRPIASRLASTVAALAFLASPSAAAPPAAAPPAAAPPAAGALPPAAALPTVQSGDIPALSASPLATSPLATPKAAAASPESCEQAAATAEAAHNLPSGLLLAIGRIESGRWNAAKGRASLWPWTINAAGKGQWFETRDAAIQAVEALRATGTRSIDTGCFQISLLHHPGAFAGLSQAFDPGANATYAARFLLTLFARTGSWESAVENYHSADPARGLAYRQQVFAVWFAPGAMPPMVRMGLPPGLLPASTGTPGGSTPGPPPQATLRVSAGVQVWTPMEAGTAPDRVAMPPPPVRAIRKPPASD